MAILQSCCFWRSVRKGSYASAIYTAAYFGVIVAIMSMFVDEERRYYWPEEEGEEAVDAAGEGREKDDVGGGGSKGLGVAGDAKGRNPPNRTTPKRPITQSFLEPEGISETSMYFNIVVLACASCGFVASFLLCCGLYIENRQLLIPWILTVVVTTIADLVHILYLMVLESVKFNPLTAIMFTIDFFLLSINIYCLLCVVSQYQEYKAGRGTALYEDFSGRLPVFRYEAPQVGTSVMSSSKRTMPTTLAASSTPAVSPTGLSILLPGGGTAEAQGTSADGRRGFAAKDGRMEAAGGRLVEAEAGAVAEEEELEDGDRWRRKSRPPKRVQFPEDGEDGREEAGETAPEREQEAGQGGGPFSLEGGHWSVGKSVGQSAMLLLSSTSVAAAAAVVVATDTAPLLSPKPPLDPSPRGQQAPSRMTFFGGVSGGPRAGPSHVVDS